MPTPPGQIISMKKENKLFSSGSSTLVSAETGGCIIYQHETTMAWNMAASMRLRISVNTETAGCSCNYM